VRPTSIPFRIFQTHQNEITGTVIAVATDIHRKLGPGLLESVYQKILAYELRKLQFDVEEERAIPVFWDNIKIDIGFRTDLIINKSVIIESKSIQTVTAVHKKTLLTYLRVADKRVGLLINFGEELLKSGVHRVVNGLTE